MIRGNRRNCAIRSDRHIAYDLPSAAASRLMAAG